LVEVNITVTGLAGELVSVTAQVPAAPGQISVGVQDSLSSSPGNASASAAERDVPPIEAVTAAVCGLVNEPLRAVNGAVDAFAGTSTEPGTVSPAALLLSITLLPPYGAFLVNVTVHVVDESGGREDAAHCTEATPIAGADSISPVSAVLPLNVAVMVAERSCAIVPALAVNTELADPADTVTLDGTVRSDVSEANPTLAAEFAIEFRVTVQTADPPCVRLAVEQLNPLSKGTITETIPAVDDTGMASPTAETATALLMPIELLAAFGAKTAFTRAIFPFGMAETFKPYARHVTAIPAALH
jgi:hypothetical protein